ncbi:MAG: hypothetical protein RIG68_04625 [Imperialibacter sp.]|uniref:hypothetical protein n=1 Tax=Imperialibacter sp. TaxID=2038411 RepID=UPI0032EF05DD
MKKLFRNLLFFSAIGSVAILASCGGDEEEPLPDGPSITVAVSGDVEGSGEEFTAITGDEVTFAVSITAPGVFNTLNITPSIDGVAGTLVPYTRDDTEVTTNADNTTASINLSYEFDEEDEGKEISWTFEAVDDSDQKATKTITVTASAPPSPEARAYSTVLLSAPIGATTAEKSSETFFSTSTGLTYSMKAVLESSDPISANIDFGYFYGASTFATLASPAAYPFAYGQAAWGTKNATTFRRTTLDDTAFGAEGSVKTWADIDAAVEAATAADADPGIESGLEEGEVLAFVTASTKTGGSKKGLILVKSITGAAGSDGKIELEILVQEDAE